LTYLLNSTQVKEIMEKNVITVTPDTTAEEAVALAQSNKVGTLVVLENGHVVGIVTTNDFFYKIVNPILGLGSKGTRLEISNAGNAKALEKVMAVVNKLNMELLTVHIEALPDKEERNICLHVASDDVSQLVEKIKAAGFQVTIRKR
jgi:acetoin utilization protein AcuB